MIRFEKFEKEDFSRLISWIPTEELMIQFSGPIFSFPITFEQLDKYVNCDTRLVYKVVNSTTNEVVGHAELNNIDKKNKSARICRILIGDNSNRNKGLGKAIINELVRIGFEEFELHRLDLAVFDFNHQGIRCYQACGFEIEGKLRETTRFGNEYWSIYNMSKLNDE
jgi:RimJ/RimL family protein N-acetyltransferase